MAEANKEPLHNGTPPQHMTVRVNDAGICLLPPTVLENQLPSLAQEAQLSSESYADGNPPCPSESCNSSDSGIPSTIIPAYA